jgi:hypothetical protein
MENQILLIYVSILTQISCEECYLLTFVTYFRHQEVYVPKIFRWVFRQLLEKDCEIEAVVLGTRYALLLSSVADPDPGSGIGYLFDPWIRDPGWKKVSIRIRDPG